MDVVDFLASRETDIPSMLQAVGRRCRLTDQHLVIAVGSLTEGLGNTRSDLDLLIISPGGQQAPSGPATVVVGRCVVDAQLLPSEEVSALLDRFDDWSRHPWDLTHAARFTIDDRTLLHRFRHGQVMLEGPRSMIQRRFPRVPELARLKLHVARQNARTIQVDMVGNRDARDYRSLVFASQDLLGQAVDALVSAYGLTNPVTKWRSRLLELLPDDWEAHLALRPSGLPAAEHVWNLHRAPEVPDGPLALRHSAAISTFSRAVFCWAEAVLLGWSAGARTLSWDDVGSAAGGRSLPLLDYDVDFAALPDGAVLARLNDFGTAIQLTSAELALALLCDGSTSESEAARAVNGSLADPADMARLTERIDDVGFSVPCEARLALSPQP